MSTLRQRCARWLAHNPSIQSTDDLDADLLQAFVLAEIARKQTPSFDDGAPLLLMFRTDADRDEFVEAWKEIHPGGHSIKVET